jgi:hypothetical protein
MPKDVVSRYGYMKSKEGPRGSEEMYESGALEDDKLLLQSEDPKRSNYYKYKNPEDAKEAYESLQAENEMRIGMKKGGKVSSASKRGDGIAQRGKTRGKMC